MPASGLEIALLLKFFLKLCYKQVTFEKMKAFVQTLYDFNFVGTVPIIVMTKRMKWQSDIVSDSHPHGN